MTIKTLEIIHNLLKEEEAKQANALYIARVNYDAQRDKEEAGEKTDINTYKKLKDKCFESHCKILRALEDFEKKEW